MLRFEGPKEWRRITIGRVAEEKKARAGDSKLPVLSVTKHDGLVLSGDYFSRVVHSRDTSSYKVLVEGEFAYATIHLDEGAIDYLRPEVLQVGAVSPMYTVFTVNSDVVLPEFLKLLLRSEEARRIWQRLGLGSVTRRKSIPFKVLKKVEIPAPPLPEQQKIAAILSSVDDAIAATRKIIEQTKRVKQGLLQTLMTRGIGHTRFKKTEIGEIPEEWEVRPLGEVAAVERGKFTARPRNDPKYYGGQTPFVQTGDVTNSDIELLTHSQTLNASGLEVSRIFPAGTILLTIAANIGAVAEATYPVAFPDSVVGIQARPSLDRRWLLYMLSTSREHLNNIATQNAQKNINLQTLRPLPIPVPDLAEQRESARLLDEVTQTIRFSRGLLESFQSLKRGLMQDLLTGRVRVPLD